MAILAGTSGAVCFIINWNVFFILFLLFNFIFKIELADEKSIALLKEFSKDPEPIVSQSCEVALSMLEYERLGRSFEVYIVDSTTVFEWICFSILSWLSYLQVTQNNAPCSSYSCNLPKCNKLQQTASSINCQGQKQPHLLLVFNKQRQLESESVFNYIGDFSLIYWRSPRLEQYDTVIIRVYYSIWGIYIFPNRNEKEQKFYSKPLKIIYFQTCLQVSFFDFYFLKVA